MALDEHGDPEFATAIRGEAFTHIPTVAAGSGVPLRVAWEASRGLRRLSGTVGALGILVASLMPTVQLLGGSLRSAALGLALSASPGRPSSAPVNQPQVRRVS